MELKIKNRKAISTKTPEMLKKVYKNREPRLRFLAREEGVHFENVMLLEKRMALRYY